MAKVFATAVDVFRVPTGIYGYSGLLIFREIRIAGQGADGQKMRLVHSMKTKNLAPFGSAMRPVLAIACMAWLGVGISLFLLLTALVAMGPQFAPYLSITLPADAILIYQAVRFTQQFRRGIPLQADKLRVVESRSMSYR